MFVVEVTALAVTIIIFRDLFTGKARLSDSNYRLRYGCGSLWSLRTSRRRWQKDVERHRPTICVKLALKCRPQLFAAARKRGIGHLLAPGRCSDGTCWSIIHLVMAK